MFDSFFGGGESSVDNSGAFRDFANQMRSRMPAYDPWINTGAQSRDKLSGQYDWLTNNPNALQDKVASGFYESPYQKYIQDMVTKRMNYNATNTGMLGSGAANRALQDELTKMTGQFMNDYIGRGMGSYGMGLQGYQGLTDLGFKALTDQSNLFEQGAAGDLQGQLSKNAYDAAQEANEGNLFGNLVGTGLGFLSNGFNPISGITNLFQGRQSPVSDWSATGGRMPQFDTGSWSY